jgi:hypothetical protein
MVQIRFPETRGGTRLGIKINKAAAEFVRRSRSKQGGWFTLKAN